MPGWAEMKVSRSTPHNPRQLITGTQKTLQSTAICSNLYLFQHPPPLIKGGGWADIAKGS